jgi:hypothetical protein
VNVLDVHSPKSKAEEFISCIGLGATNTISLMWFCPKNTWHQFIEEYASEWQKTIKCGIMQNNPSTLRSRLD